jgi:hypothetical protein
MQDTHLIVLSRKVRMPDVDAIPADTFGAASLGGGIVLRTLAVASLAFAVLSCEGAVMCQ